VIAIRPPKRLLSSVDPLHSYGIGACAVNDSSQQQTWTQSMVASDRVPNRGDEFELVAAVAHSSHASGKVDWSPLDLFEVRMHVPEARKNRFAAYVDHLSVPWHLHLCPSSHNAPSPDDNRRVGLDSSSRSVDQIPSHEGKCFRAAARNRAGKLGQSRHAINPGTSNEGP